MFVCLCVLVLARIKFVFSGFQQFGRCMNMFEAGSPSQTKLPWLSPSHILIVAVVDNELLEDALRAPPAAFHGPCAACASAQTADISRPSVRRCS